MSGAAHNWFFGAHYQDYLTGPNSAIVRGLFVSERAPGDFWTNMGLAFVFAIAMARAGIAWGDWMLQVRR
jgi:hypothetical protein